MNGADQCRQYASPPCWLHEFEDNEAPHLRWKRVYEKPSPDDGCRVLIDRLWPRGLSKKTLALDAWIKDIAPSAALRKWFGHRPARWHEFRRRYHSELRHSGKLIEPLLERARQGPVTLLISARDGVHNHAVALLEYLAGSDSGHGILLSPGEISGSKMPMPPSRKPASLTKADLELLSEFRYRLRKFLGFSEQAAVSHGVSPHQYQAMLAIEGFPGKNWVTIGELAEQMQVAHHTAVGLTKRMERLKLVLRTPSKEDRRQVRVSLTAKGFKILEKLYQAHRAELHVVGPQIADLLRRAATETPE